jgi:uncharacterized RDD family membrane protein YckC
LERLARPGHRAAAYLVDVTAIWAFALLAGEVAWPQFTPESVLFLLQWGLLASLFHALAVCLEAFTGLTLGKLLLDLRVRQADLESAPLGRRLARAACKYPSFPLGLLGALTFVELSWLGAALQIAALLGALLALRADRRALHDRLAGTAVISEVAVAQPQSPRFSPASALAEIRRELSVGYPEDAIVRRLSAAGVPAPWIRSKLALLRQQAAAATIALTRSGKPIRVS